MIQECICFLNKKKIWEIRIAIKKKAFTAENKDFYKAMAEVREKFAKYYYKKENNLREFGRAFDKQMTGLAESGVNKDA